VRDLLHRACPSRLDLPADPAIKAQAAATCCRAETLRAHPLVFISQWLASCGVAMARTSPGKDGHGQVQAAIRNAPYGGSTSRAQAALIAYFVPSLGPAARNPPGLPHSRPPACPGQSAAMPGGQAGAAAVGGQPVQRDRVHGDDGQRRERAGADGAPDPVGL